MSIKSPEKLPGTESNVEYDPSWDKEPGVASYVDRVAAQLSQEHKDYLMQRHGTLDLDPLPRMGPIDPHNWPSWKASEIIYMRALKRRAQEAEG